MNVVDVATNIALTAHWDQKRKSDGSPYITHPFAVALMLQKHGFREAVVAAGLLHDVLEDTSVTRDQLVLAVGEEVVGMVAALSEDKSKSWEERKRTYIATVSAAPDEVKAISTADKISNLSDTLDQCREDPATFWKKFTRGLPEQRWYYRTFVTDVGAHWSHPLMDTLKALVSEFEKD
jgi:(p)ppGpp synthase/HD superfamily hydrolase